VEQKSSLVLVLANWFLHCKKIPQMFRKYFFHVGGGESTVVRSVRLPQRMPFMLSIDLLRKT
jgi:ABC-type nitrate/sulfonate/bicarbonate transport system permease component